MSLASRDTWPLVWRLTRLAVPVTVGRLGVVSMGVVDTIVVGQIAPRELSHLAVGWTLNGPALIGGIGLLVGVQILTARAVGAGHPEQTGSIWRRGLCIAAAAGLLVAMLVWAAGETLYTRFGIAPELARPAAAVAGVLSLSLPLHLTFIASTNFLEAHQRPLPGAVTMWVANAVNLALNLYLVPQHGAVGSAWSTVLSRLALAALIAAYILYARDLRRCVRASTRGLDAGVRSILAIGVAAAVSAAVEAGAFAALGVIAARLGALQVATFQIATGSLVSLVFMIALGFATAGGVLVSEAVGRGDSARSSAAGWLANGIAVILIAACGVYCTTFAAGVAQAFTSDAELAASLIGVMWMVGLLMISDGGQGVADAVLRARGDNWFPTWTRLAAFVGVAPALAIALAENEGRGLVGVFEALLTASFIAYGVLLVRWMRYPAARGAIPAQSGGLREPGRDVSRHGRPAGDSQIP